MDRIKEQFRCASTRRIIEDLEMTAKAFCEDAGSVFTVDEAKALMLNVIQKRERVFEDGAAGHPHFGVARKMWKWLWEEEPWRQDWTQGNQSPWCQDCGRPLNEANECPACRTAMEPV